MAKKIYIITGEASGDILASRLIIALRKKIPDVQFFGMGGETMAATGFQTLFDISDVSVMGISEVLPRLPLILRRVRQVRDDILRVRPDVLLTVDSWGFVHRLLDTLGKDAAGIAKVHYVAPQVWIWKKGRARVAAQLFDCLLTLLPHEAPYFEKHGLQCVFVGHPVIENTAAFATLGDKSAAFRQRYGIPSHSKLLCVLPGSRLSEIKRMSPMFKQLVAMLAKHYPDLFVVVPSVQAIADKVSAAMSDVVVNHCVVIGQQERYEAFAASEFAIAASGTVTLELAACGTPHVVAYRFNRITNMMLNKMLSKSETPFGNLINMLKIKEIVPEFMLDKCKINDIYACVADLMGDADKRQRQVSEAQQALQLFKPEGMLPSEKAAEAIINMMK
jgi:lipid-A-disaccharide synthase